MRNNLLSPLLSIETKEGLESPFVNQKITIHTTVVIQTTLTRKTQL